MTAGDFAKKYGLSYTIVRSATFRTATRENCGWALDYSEAELKKAVREELQAKLIWHRDRLTALASMMEKLDGKAAGA